MVIARPVTTRRPSPLLAGNRRRVTPQSHLLHRQIERAIYYRPHASPNPWFQHSHQAKEATVKTAAYIHKPFISLQHPSLSRSDANSNQSKPSTILTYPSQNPTVTSTKNPEFSFPDFFLKLLVFFLLSTAGISMMISLHNENSSGPYQTFQLLY